MDEPSVIAEPLLDTAVVEDTQSNGHFPIPPEQMGATGMRFSARLVTFFTCLSCLRGHNSAHARASRVDQLPYLPGGPPEVVGLTSGILFDRHGDKP